LGVRDGLNDSNWQGRGGGDKRAIANAHQVRLVGKARMVTRLRATIRTKRLMYHHLGLLCNSSSSINYVSNEIMLDKERVVTFI